MHNDNIEAMQYMWQVYKVSAIFVEADNGYITLEHCCSLSQSVGKSHLSRYWGSAFICFPLHSTDKVEE